MGVSARPEEAPLTSVILLALASTFCAACSTVFKHMSANRPVRHFLPAFVPQVIVRMVANPMFLVALLFDGGAVVLQILALRHGSLSTVQPVLTLALVISLCLDHALARTRISRGELIWSGTLVAGLVLFLVSSGATHPRGGHDIGNLIPGLILGVVAFGGWGVALLLSRGAIPRRRARVQAVGVAMIYATTAALIKATTRIADREGIPALLESWQLWVLIALAAAGLVLNQHVFALAPLHVSLPVIASLDPLFSVVIGGFVFDERLRSTPGVLVLEAVGLAVLMWAVVRLSRTQATKDLPPPSPATSAAAR